MKNKKAKVGFTLVEMLIVIVVITLIGAVLGVGCRSCSGAPQAVQAHAERYAADYVARFNGWASPVILCSGEDTDGDTYVSCTVSERQGAPTRTVLCKSNWIFEWTTGCKEPRAMSYQTQDGPR